MTKKDIFGQTVVPSRHLETLSKKIARFISESLSLETNFDAFNPGYTEPVFNYILQNSFLEYVSLFSEAKHQIQSVIFAPMESPLVQEKLESFLVDFFLDEKITLKKVESKQRDNFSTILFVIQYMESEIFITFSNFSVEELNVSYTLPYVLNVGMAENY